MKRHFFKNLVCIFALILALSSNAQAQQFSTKRGTALDVDLIRTAQRLSMQNMYARALYLHLRSNPQVLDNQGTLVNFLIYLMTNSDAFTCQEAFTNEFEKRDYFTEALQLKDQLRQVVNSVQIPQRFDIAYTINTQAYKFEEQALPFGNISAVSVAEGLSGAVSTRAQSCANQILQGTGVDTNSFPWRFDIVNEAGERQSPGFPFGQRLQMPSNDARVIYGQFGRQLYAIVSYQFQAANNGEAKVQVIPTDGQLFGLSADAVVAVKSYSHPQKSQPTYLDMTNPLKLRIQELNLEANVNFQQQGFRAVGTGERKDPGTGITLGGTVPISGSAAVGNSMFIMRIHAPQLELQTQRYRNRSTTTQKYLTLIGSVDYEKAEAARAPVSGNALILEVDAQSGQMAESHKMYFSGTFTPKVTPEAAPIPIPAPSSETPATPLPGNADDRPGQDL